MARAGPPRTGLEPDAATEVEFDEAVRCSACGHEVAHPGDAIRVEGAHEHRFRNPAGWSFQVVCFKFAPGCAARGAPVDEHSWFAGHTWRLALCSACGQHLGWWFEGRSSFAGLIRTRLL